MKRIALVMLALVLPFALSVARAGAEYTFTLATHLADDAVESRSFHWLAKRVLEKTNGRLQINVSTAAALGGQREIIESVNNGSLEMGMGENALYSNYDRVFGIMTLPFIHSSAEKYFAAADGEIGKRLNAIMEKKTNMTILAWTDGVRTRDVYGVKPMNGLEDLKGMKIRTPESPVYVATFKAFGANPTPIPAPEMYTALQQGVVTAMEGTTETAVKYGIYEIAKHCLETHHIRNECSIVMNKDALAELPADLQADLHASAREMVQYNRELSRTAGDEFKNKMLASGITFVPVDPAKAAAMVSGVYKEFVGSDPVMNEILNLLLELNKK